MADKDRLWICYILEETKGTKIKLNVRFQVDAGTQKEHQQKDWRNLSKAYSLVNGIYCTNVNFLVLVIILWLFKIITLGKFSEEDMQRFSILFCNFKLSLNLFQDNFLKSYGTQSVQPFNVVAKSPVIYLKLYKIIVDIQYDELKEEPFSRFLFNVRYFTDSKS